MEGAQAAAAAALAPTASPATMGCVLFGLTEYNLAATDAFQGGIELQAPIVEPALRAFPVRGTEAVPTARVPIDAQSAVDLPPTSFEQAIRFDARRVAHGDLGAVKDVLIGAAHELAAARLAYMRRILDVVTEATGQVARVGRRLTWEAVMSALEPMEIGFDEKGDPTFRLWPPAAQAAFDRLPARTDEQERKWQSLMKRKKEAADARSRDRLLG